MSAPARPSPASFGNSVRPCAATGHDTALKEGRQTSSLGKSAKRIIRSHTDGKIGGFLQCFAELCRSEDTAHHQTFYERTLGAGKAPCGTRRELRACAPVQAASVRET